MMKMDDCGNNPSRREVAVWLGDNEKQIVSSVKKILRFPSYRAMALGLCRVAGDRTMPADISAVYPQIRESGSEMNRIAKAMNSGVNSGVKVDDDDFCLLLLVFSDMLTKLYAILAGGDRDVR